MYNSLYYLCLFINHENADVLQTSGVKLFYDYLDSRPKTLGQAGYAHVHIAQVCAGLQVAR